MVVGDLEGISSPVDISLARRMAGLKQEIGVRCSLMSTVLFHVYSGGSSSATGPRRHSSRTRQETLTFYLHWKFVLVTTLQY